MVKEAEIRDYLANHLDIIEPNLTLMKIEYHLPASVGSSGFVDILARDGFGMTVVIEIKKSNQTARSAIHELFKYVALLRAQIGSGEQIRCILVSTHWEELLQPFSEFVRSVEYPVAGYQLQLNDGRPTKAKLVDIRPQEVVRRHVLSNHMVYGFLTEKLRDRARSEIMRYLATFGVTNYFLIAMRNKRHIVPYPFVLYFVMESIEPSPESTITLDLEASLQDDRHDLGEIELLLLEGLHDHLLSLFDWGSMDIETAHAEKIASQLHLFDVEAFCRSGRYTSTAVFPEEELLRITTGTGGENAYLYYAMSTPRYAQHWESVRSRLRHATSGCDHLEEGVQWFLDRIEAKSPEASVSIQIFSPLNIIESLVAYCLDGDLDHFPSVEIVANDPTDATTIILTGFVEWNRQTFPVDPKGLLCSVMGNLRRSLLLVFSRGICKYDLELMHCHGLQYAWTHRNIQNGATLKLRRLAKQDKVWALEETSEEAWSSLQDFARCNTPYLTELTRLICSCAPGILRFIQG